MEINYNNINELATIVNQNAKDKGFYDEKPIFGDWISNIHGEVSELWEAHRDGKLDKPCDKADKMQELFGESLNCAEEELADIIIRALDTAKAMNLDIGRAIRVKHAYNTTRAFRHGNKKA